MNATYCRAKDNGSISITNSVTHTSKRMRFLVNFHVEREVLMFSHACSCREKENLNEVFEIILGLSVYPFMFIVFIIHSQEKGDRKTSKVKTTQR